MYRRRCHHQVCGYTERLKHVLKYIINIISKMVWIHT
jgi:hypothetical protein